MWRLGTANRVDADRLDFQTSTNATSLSSGTWTDHNDLDFTSPITNITPAQALDGNLAANRTARSFTITGLNIADGATFWIRWMDFNVSSSDDGLAVDDFSITPNGGGGGGITLSINDVTLAEGNSGTTAFNFTVSLSAAAPAGGVTFDIATADGTAVAPGDYAAKNLTGQTIAAGDTTYTFTVDVVGDTTPELNETFFVNVSSLTGTGVTIADGQGLGTIVNDDVTLTPIHDVQGPGNVSPIVDNNVTVEAIVVGDYQTQGSGQLRGFFIQEENDDIDADPATSEGVMVFCATCPVAVNVGDKVQVTGIVEEFFDMTQISATTAGSVTVLSSGNDLPTPATIELPIAGLPTGDLTAATAAINSFFEKFEGMLVTFPDTLTVSEYFELARYGQVILTEGGREQTFSNDNVPSVTGYTNHQINLASRTIILDDTDNRQNRPVDSPNTPYFHPQPGLSTTNYFRGGDTITDLTGVLHWSFNGQSGEDAWRIRPVVEEYEYEFTPVNLRPDLPEVEGDVIVASFNVLNYFLTIDETSSNSNGDCGPSETMDCRGADSEAERLRQRAKILAALTEIDADVFGFMEMENTPGVEPLEDLVAGLTGYDYIDTGVIGGDAIRVGIIYKTATVEPVGDYELLDSSVDARFDDSRNRPALAQTFEEIASGEKFTVVVNHLKSKGCGNPPNEATGAEADQGDGQGCWNPTRTEAAEAMADWLATDPTGSNDPDFLIIGDLNSYAMEDPIMALVDADYTDLVAEFGGVGVYGYVFDGQLGYLDHALANDTMFSQVADTAMWHINADEIALFDYNDDVRDSPGEAAFEEESDVLPLYEANEFRSSDHDPVIIGLTLGDSTPVDTTAPETTIGSAPTHPTNSANASFTFSGDDGSGSGVASFECSLDSATFTACTSPQAYTGLTDGDHTFRVRAIDNAGNTDQSPATWTWTIDTTAPETAIDTYPPNPSNSANATFTFSGNDGVGGSGVASFECRLDGGAWTPCNISQAYTGLSDGSHTFEVRAVDEVGNTDATPAGYTWVIDTSAPPDNQYYLVTTTAAGSVDGTPFDKNDILAFDGEDWFVFFDGAAAGLPAKADLTAFYAKAPNDLVLSFKQNKVNIPGFGPVFGHDIVGLNGDAWYLYFDGSDVGLTTGPEKIDSIHVMSETYAADKGCTDYLLISTRGPGKVPAAGGNIKFGGEDVLGFCATSTGDNTQGTWEMVLDGSAEGMKRNATESVSANEDGTLIYLTTKAAFNVDSAIGGHSMIYVFDTTTGEFSGPIFSAPAEGLNKKVDGMEVFIAYE